MNIQLNGARVIWNRFYRDRLLKATHRHLGVFLFKIQGRHPPEASGHLAGGPEAGQIKMPCLPGPETGQDPLNW